MHRTLVKFDLASLFLRFGTSGGSEGKAGCHEKKESLLRGGSFKNGSEEFHIIVGVESLYPVTG
jgi:hypothetical protein